MSASVTRLVAFLALVAGVALLALGSRGRPGRAGGRSEAPRLESAQAAWSAAWPAIRDGSWDALEPLLTARGHAQVVADLAAWRDALASPSVGPRTIARLPRDDASRATLERALAGDTGSLLRLLRAGAPLPGGGAVPSPIVSADGAYAQADYVGSDGSRRIVLLVATREGWRVERAPL